MFVNPEDRGKGISLKILLKELESWAEEENSKLHFETGKNTRKPSHCTRKWLRHNLKLRTIRRNRR
jgi:GNAT superfamily N-acetyltransferase